MSFFPLTVYIFKNTQKHEHEWGTHGGTNFIYYDGLKSTIAKDLDP